MKVCPKCGFVDPAYWLPSRWRITEYCRIDDLEQDQPKLADRLKNINPMKPVSDDFYFYRMNEAGFVERIWKSLVRQALIYLVKPIISTQNLDILFSVGFWRFLNNA